MIVLLLNCVYVEYVVFPLQHALQHRNTKLNSSRNQYVCVFETSEQHKCMNHIQLCQMQPLLQPLSLSYKQRS